MVYITSVLYLMLLILSQKPVARRHKNCTNLNFDNQKGFQQIARPKDKTADSRN